MTHSILFTGHMIDAAGRKEARFPAFKEYAVKKEIWNQVQKVKERGGNHLKGIAGGACGGDILFHELCSDNGIPSELFLALPVEAFKKNSVSFAGIDWSNRFDNLVKNLPVHIMPEAKNSSKHPNVWSASNMWMLHEALKNGGRNMTLIALWNGKGGDGEGGTEHMVNIATSRGATIEIIDINHI